MCAGIIISTQNRAEHMENLQQPVFCHDDDDDVHFNPRFQVMIGNDKPQ